MMDEQSLDYAAIEQAWIRYRDRLNSAVAQGETAWHRLSIRVEAGTIKVVQLALDETYAVDVNNSNR